MEKYNVFRLAVLVLIVLIFSCSSKPDYCLEATRKLSDTQAALTFASTDSDIAKAKENIKKAKTAIKDAEDYCAEDKCNCIVTKLSIGYAKGMINDADSTNDDYKLKFYLDEALKSVSKAEKDVDACSKR